MLLSSYERFIDVLSVFWWYLGNRFLICTSVFKSLFPSLYYITSNTTAFSYFIYNQEKQHLHYSFSDSSCSIINWIPAGKCPLAEIGLKFIGIKISVLSTILLSALGKGTGLYNNVTSIWNLREFFSFGNCWFPRSDLVRFQSHYLNCLGKMYAVIWRDTSR